MSLRTPSAFISICTLEIDAERPPMSLNNVELSRTRLRLIGVGNRSHLRTMEEPCLRLSVLQSIASMSRRPFCFDTTSCIEHPLHLSNRERAIPRDVSVTCVWVTAACDNHLVTSRGSRFHFYLPCCQQSFRFPATVPTIPHSCSATDYCHIARPCVMPTSTSPCQLRSPACKV